MDNYFLVHMQYYLLHSGGYICFVHVQFGKKNHLTCRHEHERKKHSFFFADCLVRLTCSVAVVESATHLHHSPFTASTSFTCNIASSDIPPEETRTCAQCDDQESSERIKRGQCDMYALERVASSRLPLALLCVCVMIASLFK